MTVHDLIELLKELPQDAYVFTYGRTREQRWCEPALAKRPFVDRVKSDPGGRQGFVWTAPGSDEGEEGVFIV